MEGKEVCEVQRLIRKISKDKGIPRPLQEILARMNAEIADFSSESFDNLVHAIKWCERYDTAGLHTLSGECNYISVSEVC